MSSKTEAPSQALGFRRAERLFDQVSSVLNGRPTIESILMSTALTFQTRSTCSSLRNGAVIALSGRIISTGYTGSASGLPHCLDEGCLRVEEGLCARAMDAVTNAIVFAAKEGLKIRGADLYCKNAPDATSAKMIITAGIETVWYISEHPILGTGPLELIEMTGIEVIRWGSWEPK